MKTYTVNTYNYEELSEEVKEKARDWWREIDMDYFWGEDCIKSLKGFLKFMDVEARDWSISWDNAAPSIFPIHSLPINLVEIVDELRTLDSCPFTGYCADEDLREGAIEAWDKGERNEEVINAAFDKWLKVAQSDYEYQQSDEAVSETIIAMRTYKNIGPGIVEEVDSSGEIDAIVVGMTAALDDDGNFTKAIHSGATITFEHCDGKRTKVHFPKRAAFLIKGAISTAQRRHTAIFLDQIHGYAILNNDDHYSTHTNIPVFF